MKPNIVNLLVALLASGITAAAGAEAVHYTTADVERAILSGEVRPDLAAIAVKRKQSGADLEVREIIDPHIPYQLFTFTLREGFTVLVEPSGKIVVLCSASGGGRAIPYSRLIHDDRITLRFSYISIEGDRHYEHRVTYVMGSGTPAETEPAREIKLPMPNQSSQPSPGRG